MPTEASSYKPDGYSQVTQCLMFPRMKCAEALDLYKTVFGAEKKKEPVLMNGLIAHIELHIGDTRFMCGDSDLADADTDHYRARAYMYVPDVDATFLKAKENGFTVHAEPEDMFWGDRVAKVADPYGHLWMLVTSKFYPTEEEMAEGHKEMEAAMCNKRVREDGTGSLGKEC